MIDVSFLNIFEIQSLRGFILKLFLIFDDVINKKAFEFGKISIPLSELPRVIVILMERLSFSKLLRLIKLFILLLRLLLDSLKFIKILLSDFLVS